MSSARIEAMNRKLEGKTVPVYETTYKLQPIRNRRHLICFGRIIAVEPPPTMNLNISDIERLTKTKFGRFCRVLVTAVKAENNHHKSKLGREFIFNVADEDIERAMK